MATTSNEKCIFCKIVSGQDAKTEILQSTVIQGRDIVPSVCISVSYDEWKDETMVVFKDIKPATPHHYLVVTKEHIQDPKVLNNSHTELVEKMVAAGKEMLQKQNADVNDVRMGFHWPPFHAIKHLHLHVISSTNQMGWIARGIFKENSYWFVTVDWLLQRLKNMKQIPPARS